MTYIGFRSLNTYPPKSGQWAYALKILTSYYYEVFESAPLCQLQNAADYIASLPSCAIVPQIKREEERTAALLEEVEDRRGTFQPMEY